MGEAQVSLGSVAYLTLGRALSGHHVKIKELNALRTTLAVLFQLNFRSGMPLGCFQLRICYDSMKCCSLPNKPALSETSIFQEHSGICLHLFEGEEHTLNFPWSLSLFFLSLLQQTERSLSAQPIKVDKRNSKWDMDVQPRDYEKLDEIKTVGGKHRMTAKDPIGTVREDQSIVSLKKFLSQIVML